MMTRTIKAAAIAVSVGLVAGCSGGGSAPTSVTPTTTNPTTPGTPNSSSPQSKATGTLKVTLRPRTSAKHHDLTGRHRSYVSPATEGIIAEFVDASNNVTYQGYTVTEGATASNASPASCTGTAGDGQSYTCTLYFNLAPGTSSSGTAYTTTLTAYDYPQSGATSTIAAGNTSTNALSVDTESITIKPDTSNAFAFTLHGIVEGFYNGAQYIGAVGGSAIASGTTTFQALDADGYTLDSDTNTTLTYYIGQQNTGPFAVPASPGFAVTAMDEGDSTNACMTTGGCTTSSSTAVSDAATEGVGYAYNGGGMGGNGTTTPYYGEITLARPVDSTSDAAAYAGYSSVDPSGSSYAGTAYIVPLFATFGTPMASTDVTPTNATTVDFTYPGQTVTVYLTQFSDKNFTSSIGADSSSCTSMANPPVTVPNFAADPANATTGISYGVSGVYTSTGNAGTCTTVVTDALGDSITLTFNGETNTATIPHPAPTTSYTPNIKKSHR